MQKDLTSTSLTLEQPAERWADEYLAFVEESIATDGAYPYNNIQLAQADFLAFVRELEEEAAGINLPPGVPAQQTFFLVLNDNTVIGEFRFRPVVQPPYEQANGHIGYNLRPDYRGQGYGTHALAIMLTEAQRQGLRGVQLPIEGNNPASVRIVEKNGGKLDDHVTNPTTGVITACYWIDLLPDTPDAPSSTKA